MRVLVLTNLFPPHALGGYEILCGQVCAGLQARGHRVTVLTTPSGPGTGGEPPVADVRPVLRLEAEFGEPLPRDPWRRHRVGLANRRAVREAAAREPFDVAFAWSQMRLTLGAVRGAQDAGLPVLFTCNDLHLAGFRLDPPRARPLSLARWLIERFLLPDVTLRGVDLSRAACISRCVRDDLAAEGVALPGARVVYQGIPLQRFPLKDDPGGIQDPPRVLYAGQLHPDKGVHTLLQAAALLARRGRPLRVSVAGDGEPAYRAHLQDLARDAGDVAFLGRLPHDEVPALYRAHDLFVFPSRWREPFGLTHLEAMASGLPVASTADGGQGEFLRDGVNALVFPREDAPALADALQRLAADGDLRRGLAARARRQVEEEFSLDRYVASLEALLAEAAGPGTGTGTGGPGPGEGRGAP